MKPLVKWLLLIALALGAVIVLNAQEPVPTRPIKTKPIKQPPVKVVKPPVQPVKVVKPEVVPDKQEQVKPAIPQQVQAPIDQMIDMEALNVALSASAPYSRTLRDPNLFIDERGYNRMSIEIIRKSNGQYALAYGASTENLDIYTKGVLFTLKDDLSQLGNSMLFTKPDEDLREHIMQETQGGGVEIVYTCNDARGVHTTGGAQGERDRHMLGLKYTEFKTNGEVLNRMVDARLGDYKLKALIKPPFCDNTTVLYNYEGTGRIALVDSYLGAYEMYCDLKPLARKEQAFSYQDIPVDHPGIAIATPFKNDFIVHTGNYKTTSYWDLANGGLEADIAEKGVWPLLVLDGFAVSSGQHSNICHYENDPYHPYADAQLNLEHVVEMFPLANGHVAVLAKEENNSQLHIFNDQLHRLHPPVDLPQHINTKSIQRMELGNDQMLIFYKTQAAFETNFLYRATIYNYATNEVIYSGEEILWEDPYREWPPIYRLVRHDDNRILAVTFDQPASHYVHEQGLIYGF